jgi:hypothetical protein
LPTAVENKAFLRSGKRISSRAIGTLMTNIIFLLFFMLNEAKWIHSLSPESKHEGAAATLAGFLIGKLVTR